MSSDTMNSVDLVWDLTLERMTIGGLLVLRQEGEMLAKLHKRSVLTVHLIVPKSDRQAAEHMAQTVFNSSVYPYQIVEEIEYNSGWPSSSVRAQPDFSYFTFSRIIALHAQMGVKPRLLWAQSQQTKALQARRQFAGRLYCVHLRSMPPFAPEESNADGKAWNDFFKRHASPDECDFMLIGNDPLPNGLNLRPGVTRMVSQHVMGLDLAEQLALIGVCDGFLGMASGLCTAANFSDTPHVIFKHPAHHSSEMARELGTAQSFPFAGERQQLWRSKASTALLEEAFLLITT